MTPESVPESAPFARSWTSRDGLRLFYRDYPGSAERPPLVCLSGLTRNSRDFADFAERYAGRFRVIVPDFRGRGLSDRDPQPERYNPKIYAADILALLDELEVDRAVFVGTSLGGIVAMLIAAIQPQRIAATILNDVGPDLDTRWARADPHLCRPAGSLRRLGRSRATCPRHQPRIAGLQHARGLGARRQAPVHGGWRRDNPRLRHGDCRGVQSAEERGAARIRHVAALSRAWPVSLADRPR